MKIDATGKSFTDQISIKTKKKKDKTVISGSANAFVVDRGNEIIETDAWVLEDFKKNPVILVEHGFHPMFAGLPVGKATMISPTDGGLKFEAEISQSKTEPITMIRDLLDEGFLKAVSVGFDSQEEDEIDGIKRIKKAALFEISLVGIPMNQDSLVEVKSYHNTAQKRQFLQTNLTTIRMEICKLKDAVFAAEIHRRILFLQKETGIEREGLLDQVVTHSKDPMEDVLEVLKGALRPSGEMIKAFAEVLVMDALSLCGIAKIDHQNRNKNEKIAKEESEAKRKKEFQDAVQARIPELVNEGMAKEQAVAIAVSRCQEGQEKRVRLTAQEYDELIEVAKKGIDERLGLFKQADQEIDQNTTPIDNSTDSVKTDNPILDLLKQNNVLLGSMINEIQGLRSQMIPETKVPDEETLGEQTDAEINGRTEETVGEKIEDEVEEKFADMVNMKFPLGKEHANLSYSLFAKSKGFEIYAEDDSRSEVYNSILKSYFKHGFSDFEPNETLDKFLNEANKSHIKKLLAVKEKAESDERLDNVRKRLENYTQRVKTLGN